MPITRKSDLPSLGEDYVTVSYGCVTADIGKAQLTVQDQPFNFYNITHPRMAAAFLWAAKELDNKMSKETLSAMLSVKPSSIPFHLRSLRQTLKTFRLNDYCAADSLFLSVRGRAYASISKKDDGVEIKPYHLNVGLIGLLESYGFDIPEQEIRSIQLRPHRTTNGAGLREFLGAKLK